MVGPLLRSLPLVWRLPIPLGWLPLVLLVFLVVLLVLLVLWPLVILLIRPGLLGILRPLGLLWVILPSIVSNWIDFVEDLGNYGFSIDYHMNLNFARGPEAYLDVEPMVSIEQQRILSHHLHLS